MHITHGRAVMAHADQVTRVPLAAAMDAHGFHSQVRRGAQLADRDVDARRHGLTLGTLGLGAGRRGGGGWQCVVRQPEHEAACSRHEAMLRELQQTRQHGANGVSARSGTGRLRRICSCCNCRRGAMPVGRVCNDGVPHCGTPQAAEHVADEQARRPQPVVRRVGAHVDAAPVRPPVDTAVERARVEVGAHRVCTCVGLGLRLGSGLWFGLGLRLGLELGLGLGLGLGLEIRVVVAPKWAHGSRVEPVPQKGSSTSEQGPAPAKLAMTKVSSGSMLVGPTYGRELKR